MTEKGIDKTPRIRTKYLNERESSLYIYIYKELFAICVDIQDY